MTTQQLEKHLQSACEKLLALYGFSPRTPTHLREPCPAPRRGWYVHVHRAMGNPILLDLLVLHKNGSYIEIELKRPGGKLSSEQEYLLNHGNGEVVGVCYTFEELEVVLKNWLHKEMR